MTEPKISIVVPAYNAEKTIKKCIESLLDIDYTNYEIIIVDDGSTDATKQILSGYKEKISVMALEHRGPSHCRNKAASASQAEYLAFTDADCIVDKQWLRELLKGFSQEAVTGVGGSQLSPNDETAFGRRVQSFFEKTGFLGGYIKTTANNSPVRTSHNPSCNVMYRRQFLLEVGGFDEGLWPGEDVDLDYRLEKRKFILMFNPKAIVYHYRPDSLKKICSMMYRYGWTQGVLVRRYGLFRKLHWFFFAEIVFVAFALLAAFFLRSAWPIFVFVFLELIFLLIACRGDFVRIGLASACVMFWSTGFLKNLLGIGRT